MYVRLRNEWRIYVCERYFFDKSSTIKHNPQINPFLYMSDFNVAADADKTTISLSFFCLLRIYIIVLCAWFG